MSPERIGGYEVVGRISIGLAEVWLGKGAAGEPVAIQKMPRTARGTLARHPNLVEIREVVRHADERYRIVEYLEGETLAAFMRRSIVRGERIAAGLATHVIAEVCDGLNAAHVAGELHRAVSPEAVFITYDGAIKVLDLGIALEDPDSLYLSPEQVARQPLGRQSDVYAIGLVLYELTTLRRVFGEPADRERELPAPSTQVESYPPQLDSICQQALARDPAQRFRSALEMRDALVTASRTLASSSDPTRALASQVMRLFGDRLAAKRALLDRALAGTMIEVPAAAAGDDVIELPVVVRDPPAEVPVVAPSWPLPPRAPTRMETAAVVALRAPKRPSIAPRSETQLETGEVITVGAPKPAAQSPAAARGVRWGVVLLFLVAIGGGGAAGAWLRLYGLPF